MKKNKYSLKVADKFLNDENTAMITFCECPFHFDGDDKTYYWNLECVYYLNESKMDMYFLVYDEENETYVTEEGTNKALMLDAFDILSAADFTDVFIMMNNFVKECEENAD